MPFTFNLIDNSWIPCVMNDGSFRELSLRELLSLAHEVSGISCETPIISTSMMPMILAVLHRVFGPENDEIWEELWNQKQFDIGALNAYFDVWYERFDLFHPDRPFYQMKDDRVKEKSAIHLIHSIGNTGTLFTHMNDEGGVQLSPAEAARYLLTAQYFRTAGLSGLDEKFTDSIFARGVLFWANGNNMFETLMLNLIQYPSQFIFPHTSADKPAWELEDMFQPRLVPYGYLDYLTWMSNRILLIPEENFDEVVVCSILVAPGLTLSSDVFSPQKRYEQREKKEGFSFLYFNTNKSLWQDYHSLLKIDSNAIKPPAVVSWLAELTLNQVLDHQYRPQLTASGMLADQAKPIFYRQESMPLPLALVTGKLDPQWVEQAISDAEAVDNQLYNALKHLADHVLMRGTNNKPDGSDRKNLIAQWNVTYEYWQSLEPYFWEFIYQVIDENDDAMNYWHRALTDEAMDALQHAIQMAGYEPWALQGGISAERILRSEIRKVFSK